MQLKKKLVLIAIAAAVLAGATAPPASAVSVCDLSPTTFEIWFIQQFYC